MRLFTHDFVQSYSCMHPLHVTIMSTTVYSSQQCFHQRTKGTSLMLLSLSLQLQLKNVFYS